MKNNPIIISQKREENRIKYSKALLFLFQLRIYFGILIFIGFLVYGIINNTNVQIYLIYLGLNSPLIVCLSKFYKKKISFRLWYMIGTMLILAFAYAVGANPTIFLLPELLIIILLFKIQYIQDNFN